MAHSILIVDDEAGIRQSLGRLEDEGFSVSAVASGEACLQAFEKRLFTCVLLDVWLPGIDGLETLERLKANYPDVSVVMISGHGRIETAVRATKLGAYDFIEKPLSLECWPSKTRFASASWKPPIRICRRSSNAAT